jgi:cell division protein FtsI/penicillin-binding protein 2
MVVIQPSTGDILAVANNTTSQYYDTALLGRLAPGSTFKVLTSTTLLTNNLVTLDQTVPCPQTLSINGTVLHNSEGEAGDYSYLNDFAQSCNNAFSSFYPKVGSTMVGAAASKYFGLNQNWDIGLGNPTSYADIPPATLGAMAEELVGQGDVLASPLSMASVAATVDNGTFKQPILVPGAKQLGVTPLPGDVDSDLKTLMAAVVSSGTAAGVFPGMSGVYAKTGTAEVQGQPDNSWLIAFQGDYAVCALAVKGGFGAATAGPEVASFLKTVDAQGQPGN